MNQLPYLLPWVRVLLLIRSITSTTWGHEAWPEVKPVLRRGLDGEPADLDQPAGLHGSRYFCLATIWSLILS
jgi:hypothetical protein